MIVGRGVEKVPGRCGGDAVLVGTRMPVRCIDGFYRSGGDDAVKAAYPHLTQQQRQDAYEYAAEHSDEIATEVRAVLSDPEDLAERALALLRKLEWCGHSDDGYRECPECLAAPDANGHHKDCEWAALIGTTTEVDT